MEPVKRVYVKPTILKVQLNHEQAVLAQCSAGTSRLQTQDGNQCSSTCKKTTMSTVSATSS